MRLLSDARCNVGAAIPTVHTIILGHEANVITCNPETASTEYDGSDRLYFEELEQPDGAIISVGRQTPNNLAMGLHQAGIKILGTSVDAIDACENRMATGL